MGNYQFVNVVSRVAGFRRGNRILVCWYGRTIEAVGAVAAVAQAGMASVGTSGTVGACWHVWRRYWLARSERWHSRSLRSGGSFGKVGIFYLFCVTGLYVKS